MTKLYHSPHIAVSTEADKPLHLSSVSFAFLAISGLFSWLITGVVFYHYYNEWTWATSFYYALEVGFSVGFCAPIEITNASKMFTVVFIIIGSTFIATSLGAVASEIFLKGKTRISVDTHEPMISPVDEDGNGMIGFREFLGYYWYNTKVYLGWYQYRTQIILTFLCIVWIIVGIIYGMLIEEWDFVSSLYFSVSALSTAGLNTPTCKGLTLDTCHLHDLTGFYVGFFILIGVPLYVCTVGHLASLIFHRAMVDIERDRMYDPIEARDFRYATTLLSEKESTTLQMGEYILLELMRLQKTDQAQIQKIIEKFRLLDVKHNNVLDYEELCFGGYIIAGKLHPKYFDFQDKTRLKKENIIAMIESSTDKTDATHIQLSKDTMKEDEGDVSKSDNVFHPHAKAPPLWIDTNISTQPSPTKELNLEMGPSRSASYTPYTPHFDHRSEMFDYDTESQENFGGNEEEEEEPVHMHLDTTKIASEASDEIVRMRRKKSIDVVKRKNNMKRARARNLSTPTPWIGTPRFFSKEFSESKR